jgi:hypothetical protein
MSSSSLTLTAPGGLGGRVALTEGALLGVTISSSLALLKELTVVATTALAAAILATMVAGEAAGLELCLLHLQGFLWWTFTALALGLLLLAVVKDLTLDALLSTCSTGVGHPT